MILNYKTKTSGYIKIGINEKETLRKITDADTIIGDELDRVVTWNGSSDMGNSPDGSSQIQIEMRNADIYSIRFE